MTDLERERMVLVRLNDLNAKLTKTKCLKDQRKREKAIRDVKNEISNYAETIPDFIKKLFDVEIGSNSLNFQHTNDIDRCIDLLESRSKEGDSRSITY